MHDPPRVRSATSFWPAMGSPATGVAILRGALGRGGDTIALRELNLEVSRFGQPPYRIHGRAAAGPSVASGAARSVGAADPSPTQTRRDPASRAIVATTVIPLRAKIMMQGIPRKASAKRECTSYGDSALFRG